MAKKKEGKKEMRCKKHPEFDPYDKSMRANRNCSVCCGLSNGVKSIGDFGGEYKARINDIDNARTKIGPMNLEQFGHVRYALGWDYHFDDAPSWHVGEKTMTIYLDCALSRRRLMEFRDEWKCKISLREWTEPKLSSVRLVKTKKGTCSTLFLTFGDNKTKISLQVEEGMTVKESKKELRKFTSNLSEIPNDKVVEKEVSQK